MSRHELLARSTPTSTVASPTPIVEKKKRRCGEMMGGATAECTAVVCCCPFAVMDMLVLALYKAPKGMWKKVIEKRKKKKKLLRESNDVIFEDGCAHSQGEVDERVLYEAEGIEDMDSDMYGKLYGNGFWRSDSQKSM